MKFRHHSPVFLVVRFFFTMLTHHKNELPSMTHMTSFVESVDKRVDNCQDHASVITQSGLDYVLALSGHSIHDAKANEMAY